MLNYFVCSVELLISVLLLDGEDISSFFFSTVPQSYSKVDPIKELFYIFRHVE